MNHKILAAAAFSSLIMLFCACAPASSAPPAPPPGKHPNILILLTDDQRFSVIGALGREKVLSPNMDRIMKMGVTFTQNHIMGGLQGAICAPSRAMLMTGKSLFHQHLDGQYIPASDIILPEYFRQQGYIPFETGKWHNGPAAFNRGFGEGENIFFGGMHPPETGGHWKPFLHHYDSSGSYKGGFSGSHFSSIYYADAAIQFLDEQKLAEQKNAGHPFFAYVAFTAPHDPRHAPKEFRDLYDSAQIQLPPNYKPDHPFDNGELTIRDEELLPHPRTKEAVQGQIAAYYAMVSEVDHEIGRVLDELEKNGQADNTIIVFASDNGLAVGQHGLLGKQNLYDHSIRVPLVIAGPGIPAGIEDSGYCYLFDLFPTLCELAGYGIPAGLEGLSLAKRVHGRPSKERDHLFFAYSNLQRGVKKGGYKLIRYNVHGDSRVQLFNLTEDPYELNDLSGQAKYASKVRELSRLLTKDMKDYQDFCDLGKPGWGYPRKLTDEERSKINP
ncbi:MAG: sulfatase-like hydrolase/transferase [Puia sp.]|nr:sulfatase-like hydrolase/transferase [Puia sp.]